MQMLYANIKHTFSSSFSSIIFFSFCHSPFEPPLAMCCTLGSRTICRHFKIERGMLYTMKIIAIISFSRAWKFTEEEKKHWVTSEFNGNLWTVSTVLSVTWFNHFKSTDLVYMRKPVRAIKLLIVHWKDH